MIDSEKRIRKVGKGALGAVPAKTYRHGRLFCFRRFAWRKGVFAHSWF
jgi:hypothetical protein